MRTVTDHRVRRTGTRLSVTVDSGWRKTVAKLMQTWTAMPTSARLSAGASLTPSPVMPQRNPSLRRHSTMRYLCSGYTCQRRRDRVTAAGGHSMACWLAAITESDLSGEYNGSSAI
jgi:hypothetical protein